MVRRSGVWLYFKDVGNQDSECTLCNRRVRKLNNTTNLITHLKLHHKIDVNNTGFAKRHTRITKEKISVKKISNPRIKVVYHPAKREPSTEYTTIVTLNKSNDPIQQFTQSKWNSGNQISVLSPPIDIQSTNVVDPNENQLMDFVETIQPVNETADEVNISDLSFSQKSDTKVGFIGAGNMAYALAKGLIKSKYLQAGDIFASAPSNGPNLTRFKQLGCQTTNDNSKMFQTNDNESFSPSFKFFLFICVKPNVILKTRNFWKFLTKDSFQSSINISNLVIVSVMAGTSLSFLRQEIFSSYNSFLPLARIMPNIACAVNAGAMGLAFNENDFRLQLQNDLKELLATLGNCQMVPEEQLDAVCGLSGSGIGFVLTMIQAMADGGVLCGLQREVSEQLAAQVVQGAAAMIKNSPSTTIKNPIELRNQVCSPGGTTIHGLLQLERGSFNATVMQAIQASTNHSKDFFNSL